MPAALKTDLHTEKDRLNVPEINLSQVHSLLDGDLHYFPTAFNHNTATQLYRLLQQEISWRQEQLLIFGKQHTIPRLQSWIAEPPLSYRYSGKTFQPSPWPTYCKHIADRLNQQSGYRFNALLANWYRSGLDHMGWHSDNEAELGKHPVIASFSFGCPRDFAIRRIGESKQHIKLSLAPGSLLIMGPNMQSRWQHALPKRKKQSSGRINLTYRHIVTPG